MIQSLTKYLSLINILKYRSDKTSQGGVACINFFHQIGFRQGTHADFCVWPENLGFGQAMKCFFAGKAGRTPQFILNTQQLIVLGNPITS